MKRILCIILCAVMAFCALPINAMAEGGSETPSTTKAAAKAETKVTGIEYLYNLKQSQKLAFEITVSPANPARTVLLQRYNSEKKKYYTKVTYTTNKMKKAKLRVVIPKKFRRRTYGKWRIVVEASDKAKRYISKPIKVYSSNVRTLELSSDAACIYCIDTDKVIYNKSMERRLKPASCTKIMTLITVIETGKFGGTSPVTYRSVNVPAERLHAIVGDRYRNRDLCYAMILGSANDAAVMLASGTAGSNDNFVRRMNNIVDDIGLENTHFTNTFGDPNKNHYTTAYDLSRITAYGYNYNRFCEVVGTEQYGFKSLKNGKRYGCYTADHMVRDKVKGHIGGKTGYSEVYGASYSGLFKYKGRVYAVTQMNAESKGVRWKDVRKLYKYVRKYSRTKY